MSKPTFLSLPSPHYYETDDHRDVEGWVWNYDQKEGVCRIQALIWDDALDELVIYDGGYRKLAARHGKASKPDHTDAENRAAMAHRQHQLRSVVPPNPYE